MSALILTVGHLGRHTLSVLPVYARIFMSLIYGL